MSVADCLVVWERIDAVLKEKMFPAFSSFLPGATWDEVLNAERVIGQVLPDCVRAAYLRHNGQQYKNEGYISFLMPFAQWLPLDAMLEDWRMLSSLAMEFDEAMTAPERRDSLRTDHCAIRNVSFHAGHIPIGSTFASSHFFVDLAPGDLGLHGQVFSSAPEDVDVREPEATSLEVYMLALVNHLESGRLIYNKGRGLMDSLDGDKIVQLPRA
jgi:cell wall assembly regulator SMI1